MYRGGYRNQSKSYYRCIEITIYGVVYEQVYILVDHNYLYEVHEQLDTMIVN